MAIKKSAGILAYRKIKNELEFFLVHPGGPYWQKKDLGAWSLPKGEFLEDEDPLDAAKREFFEETGSTVSGTLIELTPAKQKAGKTVYAWAIEADVDADNITSNIFEMEWPPKSKKMAKFPEVDRAAWFSIDEAKAKINTGQAGFIDELLTILQ